MTSWITTNSFGAILTREQAIFLMRELGIEEYVGVGCSRTAAPYSPETNPGWNVSAGWMLLSFLQCLQQHKELLLKFLSETEEEYLFISLRLFHNTPCSSQQQ